NRFYSGFEHPHLPWSANANEEPPPIRKNVAIPTTPSVWSSQVPLMTCGYAARKSELGRFHGIERLVARFAAEVMRRCSKPIRARLVPTILLTLATSTFLLRR